MAKRTGGKPSDKRRGGPAHTPESGDIIWLSLSPQAGRRRARVFSPRAHNSRAGLGAVCPVTGQLWASGTARNGGNPTAYLLACAGGVARRKT